MKLVELYFGSGSDSRLFNPVYDVNFELKVSAVEGEEGQTVEQYYPGLLSKQKPIFPDDLLILGEPAELTSNTISRCIREQLYLTVPVDDNVGFWAIDVQSQVLFPTKETLVSGSITGDV